MHGADFDHFAAPSKSIRGTVREKGTSKPIAGIRVGCQAAAGEDGSEAFTDKQGRYEITGIRKSDQYYLNVGYRSRPYINYSKEVGDTPGLQPITVDFEVERGLLLRVRVTEKNTGKPVRGLVEYAIRSENANLSEFKTYPRDTKSWDLNEKDGTCEQTVLPGPGYIAFRATKEDYSRSRLKGYENGQFLDGVILQPLFLGTFHAVAPINPSANDPQSLICDIVLDRGRTLTGTVVDPKGRPLTGTKVCGLHAVMSLNTNREADSILETADFTATGLDPHYPRGLIFYHVKKKLAKTVIVRGEEKGPLTVRLEPLGAVTGRLIDADAKPRAGLAVFPLFEEKQLEVLPAELVFSNAPLHDVLLSRDSHTDKDGRFRIEGLVAGLKYDLGVSNGKRFLGRVRRDVSGKPGVTVDVGEIKTKGAAENPER
jgi:hypothetical protein